MHIAGRPHRSEHASKCRQPRCSNSLAALVRKPDMCQYRMKKHLWHMHNMAKRVQCRQQ